MDYEGPGRWDPETSVRHNLVMGDLFQTLGIPLLRGRDFTSQDFDQAHGIVIVNQKMARRHWPDQDPIGRQLTLRSGSIPQHRKATSIPLEVVGVVGDIHEWSLQSEPQAAVYVPRVVQQQSLDPGCLLRLSFMVRTSSEATSLIPAVRAAVADVDPEVPIFAVAPMKRLYLIWTGESRFYTLLLGVFAGLSLILSAIGICVVMAHSVTRRTHEIGIRMALGAQSVEVLKAVMRWGVALTMIGVALGLATAFVLTRVTGAFGLTPVVPIESSGIDSVLYGITPTDPATFVAVAIVMTVVALLACYIPARRATKVEPVIALRHE
jgi:putative ABC transport system permease protein